MSTKNLSRTIIEGGRSAHYKMDVADYAASERAETRAYLRAVARDPERADEVAVPKRKASYPEFADKLGAVYKFLDSRLGRSWNKTYAMVRAKFDVRTTPGRHIVLDHMLGVIALNGEHKQPHFYGRYFVERGILRRHRRFLGVPAVPGLAARRPSALNVKALVDWLGVRKVGQQGAQFVWWVPTRSDVAAVAHWGVSGLTYAEVDDAGAQRFVDVQYRPAGLLTGKDDAFFRSLPEWARETMLRAAPSHGGPNGRVLHESNVPAWLSPGR
jgi:hypothetical protein